LAPLPGNTESIFLNDKSFGKPCLKDLFLQAYLATPLGCFPPILW
jgi:hypothetical protein